MKLLLIVGAALVAYFLFRSGGSSEEESSNPDGFSEIPVPVAPIVTGNDCIGKTDKQGNWYGVDISGSCTVEALGGAGGDWGGE